MNASLYFQLPTGTTTTQFAAMYSSGKTITERLDAIINALITSTTSTTINDAATTDLSAISGAFPAGSSVDEQLVELDDFIDDNEFDIEDIQDDIDALKQGLVSENVFY